jgi:hypothetical protein
MFGHSPVSPMDAEIRFEDPLGDCGNVRLKESFPDLLVSLPASGAVVAALTCFVNLRASSAAAGLRV